MKCDTGGFAPTQTPLKISERQDPVTWSPQNYRIVHFFTEFLLRDLLLGSSEPLCTLKQRSNIRVAQTLTP